MAKLNIGHSIFKGSILVISVTVLLSLLAFVKQIILGWILTKEEFGIYGIAMSLSVLISCLQDSSITKVLIQRGEFQRQNSAAGLFLSILFSLVASVLLTIAAIVYGDYINEPILIYIVIFQVASLIISSFAIVFKAKLASDLNFKRISQINLIVNVIKQLSVVLLAYCGMGVFSFVIPLVIASIVELRLYKISTYSFRFRDFYRRLDKGAVWSLFRDVRWLMLSGVAIAVITKGDYFILGTLINTVSLGIYFFGFQLAGAFATLLTGSVGQVFMPALSKIKDDEQRLSSAYTSSIRMISSLTFPVCVLTAILIPPFMHWIWKGQWDEAIIVSQLILISLPLRILAPIGRSFLEAKGQWRTVVCFLYIDAAGVIIGSIVGGMLNSIPLIAIIAASWRIAIGIIQIIFIPYVFHESPIKVLSIVMQFLLPCLLALWSAVWFTGFEYSSDMTFFSKSIILSVVFVVIYALLSFAFLRKNYTQMVRKIISYI